MIKEYFADTPGDHGLPTTASKEEHFISNFSFGDGELPVFLSVADFMARKVLRCISGSGYQELLLDTAGKSLVINISENMPKYFKLPNRGGLNYPSNLILHAFPVADSIFKTCLSQGFEKAFLNLQAPKRTLLKMALHCLQTFNLLSIPVASYASRSVY